MTGNEETPPVEPSNATPAASAEDINHAADTGGVKGTLEVVERSLIPTKNLAAHINDVYRSIRPDVFRWMEPSIVRTVRDALKIHELVPPTSSIFESIWETRDIAARISGISRGIDWSHLLGNLPTIKGFVVPENLYPFYEDERLDDVCRVADEDGTSLAWAPRSEIVAELIDADDLNARSQVFEKRADEVVEDVEESISHIRHPGVSRLREALEEACSVGARGEYWALQALASNIADSVMNRMIFEYLGVQRPVQARKYFKPMPPEDVEEAQLGEVRLLLVGAGAETAWRGESVDGGVLPSYNRHESAHRIGEVTAPAHAIRALLLAQALVRWFSVQMHVERNKTGE